MSLAPVHVKDILSYEENFARENMKFKRPVQTVVLEKGIVYEGSTNAGFQDEKKECFHNALIRSSQWRYKGPVNDLPVLYCEGYGLPGDLAAKGLIMPFDHAWCVTPEGDVIDTTWEPHEHNTYIGVPVAQEWL